MDIVTDNTERQFRRAVESLADGRGGRAALHVALSRRLPPPEDLFADPDEILPRLSSLRRDAESLCAGLADVNLADGGTAAYLFRDSDIAILARLPDEASRAPLPRLQEALAAKAGKGLCALHIEDGDDTAVMDFCRGLAEERTAGARRIDAYEAVADPARRKAVGPLRLAREERLALIVEDDLAVATWAAHALSGECELVHVRSGEDAVINYLEYAPDIVFLNIHLPGIDGYQTLRALRRADADAYVVMFTGDATQGNVLRSLREGAAGFLKKPTAADRLTGMVQRAAFFHSKKS